MLNLYYLLNSSFYLDFDLKIQCLVYVPACYELRPKYFFTVIIWCLSGIVRNSHGRCYVLRNGQNVFWRMPKTMGRCPSQYYFDWKFAIQCFNSFNNKVVECNVSQVNYCNSCYSKTIIVKIIFFCIDYKLLNSILQYKVI